MSRCCANDGRTNRHTDGRTDGQTDRQGDSYIAPTTGGGGIITPDSVFPLKYSIIKAYMSFIVHRLSTINDKAS